MRPASHRTDIDYSGGYDHTHWPAHRLRVAITSAMIAHVEPASAIDPAAGDGAVLLGASRLHKIDNMLLGDISEKNANKYNGVVGDAIQTLFDNRGFDICVLSETIEHVASPDALVAQAYGSAKMLVASSPIIPQGGWDNNEEHLWMFDEEEYEALLTRNGWKTDTYVRLDFPNSVYNFQIWRMRK